MDIVVIDDHRLITESLEKLLLQFEIVESVKTFSNSSEFLSQLDPLHLPHILITDLLMPGIGGMKLIEISRSIDKHSRMKIIVLSSVIDVKMIKQTIRSGASGFLSKDTSISEVMEAINEVIKGNQYIGRNLRDSLVKNIFVEEQVVYQLSNREKEVLQKVCSGQTIKAVAVEMGLSVHTVQYYHRNVLSKLKLKKTSDLIVYSMQHGLYTPDSNKANS